MPLIVLHKWLLSNFLPRLLQENSTRTHLVGTPVFASSVSTNNAPLP